MDVSISLPVFDPADEEELLFGWSRHVHKQLDKHRSSARRYDCGNRWLGVTGAVLSAAVGTAVFASLRPGDDTAPLLTIAAGILSFCASMCASLGASLNLGQKAEAHRVAAARYKSKLRELEQLLAQPAGAPTYMPGAFDRLRERLEQLELEAPIVPADIDAAVDDRYLQTQISDRRRAVSASEQERRLAN